MSADLLSWAGLLAATMTVVRAPLSLLLMCLALRLLGASNDEVRQRALKFADEWIKQRGWGISRGRGKLR